MSKIDRFQGQYRFLSNFYPAPTAYEGIVYPTSEHAYQAAKLIPSMRVLVQRCATPGDAKRMGNSNNGDTQEGWYARRIIVMRVVLIDKFTRNPRLAQLLVATGTAELVEGNTWGDRFWGVCDGVGENQLGIALMCIRKGLIALGVRPA